MLKNVFMHLDFIRLCMLEIYIYNRVILIFLNYVNKINKYISIC